MKVKIELIRGPKFYKEDSWINNVESLYVPLIIEIKQKSLEIMGDLVVAKLILRKNKNLLDVFREKIFNGIVSQFDRAYINFEFARKNKDFNIKKSEIFNLLYPFENINSEQELNAGKFGNLILDDDFNKKLNKVFNEISQLLEENIIETR